VFLLTLIPLAWGYFLATRLLRESQRWLRWSLAYALGLLSFLAAVNALFHFLPLRPAVYLSLALLLLGSALLFRLPGLRIPPSPLGPVEGPVLALLALTAFFEALFWQMQWSDDDFFVHAPLVALFLRDVFPPQNPYYPTLPWVGHYGRDLAIAATSVLFGERFLAVQYFVTAANQATAVLIVHGTARRFLRSPSQALWAVLFAFAGVNIVGRRGLLETFQNNNAFAFLFLFVSLYLFLTAFTRRSLIVTGLAGLAFGTFALIYETSYGLLAIAFAAFPFVLCALRRRWRLRYFAVTAGLLLLSVALALVQGGTLSELAKRRLHAHETNIALSSEDQRGTHQTRIRIPKPGFTVTGGFTGEDYPLWSWRLAEDSGVFVPLLPLTAFVMLWRRRPWGILVSGLGAVAILIPAAVDFGSLNSESPRFLIVGGVAAALLFGVTAGMTWDAVQRRGPWTRRILAGGLTCIAVLALWPSTKVAFEVARRAARYPREHYLSAEEWGCARARKGRHCEPIDVCAAAALRSVIRKGERVLVNFSDDDAATLISAQAVFSAIARAPLSGATLRALPEGNAPQNVPYVDGEGFRARAFFATGEVNLLDDLGVSYVYLNPERVASAVYRRIQHDPRLERVLHLEWPGGGAVREAYRVKPVLTALASIAPQELSVVSAEPPARMLAGRVYPVQLVLFGTGRWGRTAVRLSYEIRHPGGKLETWTDEVRLPVELEPAGPRHWRGTLWLATPLEVGNHDVSIYGWDGDTRVPLRGLDGRPVVIRVRVD
jgi:hypothetical protein